MIKKILIKIFYIVSLASCGFTPMYSNMDANKLNIKVINFEGDNIINSKIISKLKFHNDSSEKLFKIRLNTIFVKSDLSKNLKGEVTEYQLNATTNYKISGENVNKELNVSESFTMKNFADNFEEKNYEKRLKENIANVSYQKLIMQILKLK